MPFNRINLLKALSSWLSVLQTSDSSQPWKEKKRARTATEQESLLSSIHEEGDEDPICKPIRQPLQCWIPGLLVIPIPEAGPILGYIDIAYLAVISYVIGSVVYVVDSFYLWYSINPSYTDDALNPAIYLNTIAAGIFVINALICILDWYLQVKQLSCMNLNIDNSNNNPMGVIEINDISSKITLYYFYNNLFFLAAALVFLIQGIWQEDHRTDKTNCLNSEVCNDFWVNFTGGMFYLISSAFSCGESFEDRRSRKRDNLPQIYLFTTKIAELDWFGWGDILYFVTGITAVIQPFFVYMTVDDDTDSVYYIVSNVLFLIDSLIYLIGYLLFIYDLRYCLLTGVIPIARTASISGIIGDNFEGAHINGRASFSFDPNHNREYVSIDEVKEQLITSQIIKHRRSSERSVSAQGYDLGL